MAERASVEQALASPRIAIEAVTPAVEEGRFAAKALIGRPLALSAVLICDGHRKLGAEVLWRMTADEEWQALPMVHLGNDHWQVELTPEHLGMLHFRIQAWVDDWASYRDELEKKHQAGVPVELELQEGERLIHEVLAQAAPEHIDMLEELLVALAEPGTTVQRVERLLAPQTDDIMRLSGTRPHLTRSSCYRLDIERRRAEFASWYELFPRSESGDPDCHGTFDDVIRRLPDIARMGFDVLYFPPIHPIGLTHRKGPNNSLQAGPDDPRQPLCHRQRRGRSRRHSLPAG